MVKPTVSDAQLVLSDPRLTRERLYVILARCEISESGCWVWTGNTDRGGYGRVAYGPRKHGLDAVHRVIYAALVGSIPEGLELDHVKANGCTSRACCKAIADEHGPTHLEPVTHLENMLRGDLPAVNAQLGRSVTHCPAGHPYNEENTYWKPATDKHGGRRSCLACKRERYLGLRPKTKPRGRRKPEPEVSRPYRPPHGTETHCPQGHPYDEANTGRWRGSRYCRACKRDQWRARQRRAT